MYYTALLTLWDEEGLASSHSGIDEPASSCTSFVSVLFMEPKEQFACTEQAPNVDAGTSHLVSACKHAC